MIGKRHRTIGIMADSHGDPQSIASGADYLVRRGCIEIYHLGDICDTNQPNTADRCVSVIKHHGIRAVRGNNDVPGLWESRAEELASGRSAEAYVRVAAGR